MAKDFKTLQEQETTLHLKLLYEPSDTLWIMLRNQTTSSVEHRKIRVEKLLSSSGTKFMATLRHYNANGYDVYITLNSFYPDSTSRRAEEAERLQNKIYIDIDGDKLGKDGREILTQILAETGLPKPTLVIRTSSKNYQAIWRLSERRSFEELKAVMQALEQGYGLDHVSDEARVFRLAGFKNKKKQRQGDIADLVLIDRLLSSGKSYSWDELKSMLVEINPRGADGYAVLREKQLPDATPLQKISHSQSQELKAYMDKLNREARRLGLKIQLSLNVENKSYSEIEFAFAKELLRQAPLWKATKILHTLVAKHRPEKLKRSPDYVSLTIASAYKELKQERA